MVLKQRVHTISFILYLICNLPDKKAVNAPRAIVAPSLEAGAVGASTAYADAHLERCPQSPCPGSAHTGLVGRRRRDRRGALGARLQFAGPLALSGTTFFSSTTCSSRCPTGLLPTLLAPQARPPSTRCSMTACSSVGGIFYTQQAFSRVRQRCCVLPQTHSISSPSILHMHSSFHTHHFDHRHTYTRLQYRLGHRSRTNLTHHMT